MTVWIGTAGDQEVVPQEPLPDSVIKDTTTPDWIQKVQEDQPAVSAAEETAPAMPNPAPTQDDISITSWLSKLDVEEALVKKTEVKKAEVKKDVKKPTK